MADGAGLEQIGAVDDLQDLLHVLLDDQHREPALADAPHQLTGGCGKKAARREADRGGPKRIRKARFAERLAFVFDLFPRLKERRTQLAGTMSGGEQQMCAIGRALMSNPKLLLLDEPSAGLAPVVVQQVFELVKRIRASGLTVLIVEQNVQQVLKVVDRAYLLETGRIRASGKSADLLADKSIREAYLGI